MAALLAKIPERRSTVRRNNDQGRWHAQNANQNEHQDRGEVQIIKAPEQAGDGSGWLIIDDLVDTGETGKVLRKMMPKGHFATVYAKPKGRPVVDTFITEVSQDTWIFFPWDLEPRPSVPIAGSR